MSELKFSDIIECYSAIANGLRETPVVHLPKSFTLNQFGLNSDLFFKFEHMQNSGSFKLRGALSVIQSLSPEKIRAGFTAVSAGNHAIATAYAAKVMGTTAKVVMLATANPERVRKAKSYGAEVIMAPNGEKAFELVNQIQNQEGRTFIHPFDGPRTTTGVATLALEWVNQVKDLDAVVIAIGGGGLASGVSFAIKNLLPQCQVYGVNVVGAEAMYNSFKTKARVGNHQVVRVADSLCPPFVGEFAFSICSQYLDDVVQVTEDEIRHSMKFMFDEFKLMIEGAGAAALAAAVSPLKSRLQNKRVGILVSGSNIDSATFFREISQLSDNTPAL